MLKKFRSSTQICLALLLSLFSTNILPVSVAYADHNDDKITICHATASIVNPYNDISVDKNAADGISGNSGNQADHYGQHTGPVFNPAVNNNGDNWGDIIPPIAGVHAGLNWTTAGQAIYNGGNCNGKTPATPTAPTKNDPCGTINDSYTIPSTTGVIYETGLIIKTTKPAGTYSASGTVFITAKAASGYSIPQGATTSWTFTYTNVTCQTTVTPQAPTASPLCGPNNDTIVLPTQTGVTYNQTAWVNGSLTVTAVAQPGYILAGQTSWVFTDLNVACLTPVTPTAPTLDDICELADDTFTIPTKIGVQYLVNGQVTAAGTYSTGLASSVTVSAQALAGYMLNGTSSWTLDFTNDECPKVTICHATGSETNPYEKITPSTAGVFNGHLGNDHQNGEDIIPPFTWKNAVYSQNWDDEGQALWNNDCQVMVTPEEPQFYDVCGDIYDDIIYIPSTTGVIYKINGEVVESGWNPAPTSDVTVTAEAVEGYTFTEDATTSWDFSFTNEDCLTITKTALPLTDTNKDGILGVGDTVTWEITITNNGDKSFENFMVQVSDDTAVLENDGLIESLAPGESVTLTATTLITPAHVSTVCKVENTAIFGATYNSIELQRVTIQNDIIIDEEEPRYDFTGSASAEMTFTCPTPGSGGGNVLTSATTTKLPATLPATGGEPSGPLALVLAMIAAYGAVYFLQGRRQLNTAAQK